jgi:N-acetylglucosamine kinase-like BadF-type ATPase
MDTPVFLGIDGGATKTEVALIGDDGAFLADIFGGPTRLNHLATRTILANLGNLIDYVCDEAKVSRDRIAAAGLGIHGVDFAREVPRQRRSLVRPLGLPDAATVLVNDGVVALWGGSDAPRAVALQIGTGFTAAYRSAYGAEHPFDPFNAGLGINLRERIYAVAYRVADGREEPSILPELMLKYFDAPDIETVLWRWHKNKIPVLDLLGVGVVFKEAVERGDAVALKLAARAADEYAHDVATMAGKIGGGAIDVVLGGGMLRNGPAALLSMIEARVKEKLPAATVHAPRLSPAVGGAVLAAFRAGRDVPAIYRRVLETRPS